MSSELEKHYSKTRSLDAHREVTPAVGPADYELSTAFNRLADYYESTPSLFSQKFVELVNGHRTLLRRLLLHAIESADWLDPHGLGLKGLPGWWREAMDPDCWVNEGYLEDPDTSSAARAEFQDLNDLIHEVKAMAHHWGLRSDWGPALIFQNAVIGSQVRSPRFRTHEWDTLPTVGQKDAYPNPIPVFVSSGGPNIVVEARYRPEIYGHDEFKNLLMAEIEPQMKTVEEQALRRGKELIPYKPALEYYIWWLYLAICPDPNLGRPLIYREIADRHYYREIEERHCTETHEPIGEDTVSKAIGGKKGLAIRLGITLPNKQGRPPAHKKT